MPKYIPSYLSYLNPRCFGEEGHRLLACAHPTERARLLSNELHFGRKRPPPGYLEPQINDVTYGVIGALHGSP